MERGREKIKGLSMRSKMKETWKSIGRHRHRSRGSNQPSPPSPQPGGLTNISPQASSQSLLSNSGSNIAISDPDSLPTRASPPLDTGNAIQAGNSAAIAGVPSVVITPPAGETSVTEKEPETGQGVAVAQADTPAAPENNACEEAADQAAPEPDVYRPLSVKAYAELQDEEKELVANYRKAILNLQQSANHKRSATPEPTDELEQLEQIQTRAKKMIDEVPDTYLSFTVNIGGERKLVVREGVQKVVKLLLKYKDVIKEGMAAAPQGALIWAGVAVVLPVSCCCFIIKGIAVASHVC